MLEDRKTFPLSFLAPVLMVSVFFGIFRSQRPDPAENKVSPPLEVFLNAQEVGVFSLDPSRDPLSTEIARQRYGAGYEALYNYPVLGRVVVSVPTELVTIRGAVHDIDRAAKAWHGMRASCFDPHHCLRVTTATGTHDLLICYMCSAVHVIEGGRVIENLAIGTDDPNKKATPEKLNALLKKHAIPLAK